MQQGEEKERHHVWVHYPDSSLLKGYDILVRLESTFTTRQAAHRYMKRMEKNWAVLPDAVCRELVSKACLEGCGCRNETEEMQEAA